MELHITTFALSPSWHAGSGQKQKGCCRQGWSGASAALCMRLPPPSQFEPGRRTKRTCFDLAPLARPLVVALLWCAQRLSSSSGQPPFAAPRPFFAPHLGTRRLDSTAPGPLEGLFLKQQPAQECRWTLCLHSRGLQRGQGVQQVSLWGFSMVVQQPPPFHSIMVEASGPLQHQLAAPAQLNCLKTGEHSRL